MNVAILMDGLIEAYIGLLAKSRESNNADVTAETEKGLYGDAPPAAPGADDPTKVPERA